MMIRRTTSIAAFMLLLLTAVSINLAQQVLPLMTKPVNTAPTNGTTVNTTTPLLEWSGSADTYKVVVKNELGEKVFSAGGTQDDLCTLNGGGGFFDCTINPADTESDLPNGTLTWRVKAKEGDEKAKSDATTFTVNYPGTPILTSPANGATVNSSPVLEWEAVDVALLVYKVKIKNTQTGAKFNSEWLGAGEMCTSETCLYATELGFGTYKWSIQVAPFLNEAYIVKSEKRTFTIEPPIQG